MRAHVVQLSFCSVLQITEIYGSEQSGKTTLALHVLARECVCVCVRERESVCICSHGVPMPMVQCENGPQDD